MPKNLNRDKSNLFEIGPDPLSMNEVAHRNAVSGNKSFISENQDLVTRRIADKKAKAAIEGAAIDKELEGRVGHLSRLNRALQRGKHYGKSSK